MEGFLGKFVLVWGLLKFLEVIHVCLKYNKNKKKKNNNNNNNNKIQRTTDQ